MHATSKPTCHIVRPIQEPIDGKQGLSYFEGISA